MESGLIFEWIPGNPIVDNVEDVEQINAYMYGVRYEEIS